MDRYLCRLIKASSYGTIITAIIIQTCLSADFILIYAGVIECSQSQ